MPGIRIVLVHSIKLFRESLKALLEDEADFAVAGQSSSAGDALRLVDELKADIVLIEAGMPGPSSIEAVRQMQRLYPQCKAVFTSSFEDEDLLFECMQAGAAGFISKDNGAAELIGAIRQIARGGKFLTAPALSRFVDGWRDRKLAPGGEPSSSLTSREREVLKLLAEGNSVKECAAILTVSAKTIEAHKFNLMRKLDIHNKAQLVHYAYQKKIVRLQLAS